MIEMSNFRIIDNFLLATDKLLGFTDVIDSDGNGVSTQDLDEVMRTMRPSLYKGYDNE